MLFFCVLHLILLSPLLTFVLSLIKDLKYKKSGIKKGSIVQVKEERQQEQTLVNQQSEETKKQIKDEIQ